MVKVITDDIKRTQSQLTYDGNIEIVGTVCSGAKLNVHGDIAVSGDVEDAEIKADGDVLISGGFLGAGMGRIVCEGRLTARFIQGQRVVAKGDVRVQNAIVSSMIFSAGEIVVTGARGSIVGGQTHAYHRVEAGVLGSVRPVTTRVEAGVDPVTALKIEDLELEAMRLTRRRMGILKDLESLGGGSSHGDTHDRAADMRATAGAIQGDVIAIGEQITTLRKNARVNPSAEVSVRMASYPPLEISICRAQIVNDSNTGAVSFKFFDDRIILDTWNLE
jgi:uncharacterized protein (DUF342 family)